MKRFPEKMMMAAIILSCGFAMQADPSAQRSKTKNTVALRKLHPQLHASARQLRSVRNLASREERGW